MTFTYSVTTALGKLRMSIGDTVASSGPRPGSGTATNFTDEELNELITVEGTWQKAVAGVCEILGNAWAIAVTFSADGLSVSRSDIARAWQAQAATWRKKYGGGYRSGGNAVTRADGFSDDVTNVEV